MITKSRRRDGAGLRRAPSVNGWGLFIGTAAPIGAAVFAATREFLSLPGAAIAAAAACCIWAVMGFQRIQPVRAGIPTLLGHRLRSEYREGPAWVIPGVMSIIMIDMNRRTINTRQTEVVCRGGERVAVDASMLVMPAWDNLKTYVEVGSPEESAKQWLLQRLTQAAGRLTVMEIGRSKRLIREIMEDLNGDLTVESGRNHLITSLGIAVLSIQVEKIVLPQDISDAAAQRDRERLEREAEKIQLGHFTEMVNTLAEKLGISKREAADRVLALMEKPGFAMVSGPGNSNLPPAMLIARALRDGGGGAGSDE